MTHESDTADLQRFIIVRGPLRAAAQLQKKLPIDPLGYRRVIGHTHADAKSYFLFGCMDEVIKAVNMSIRCPELGAPSPPASTHESHLDSLTLESIIDEQMMWMRKLVEVVSDLL